MDEDKNIEGIEEGAEKAADAVKEGAEKAADAVKEGAEKAADAVKDGAEKAAGAVEEKVGSAAKAVEKAPKNKKKKWIILIVIVVVLICLIAGFFVWHEKPSFCNAICHTPMDSYVEGWYGDDETLTVKAHASADITCLDCHVPTISQQMSEGLHWVTGDYDFNTDLNLLGEKREYATSTFCLTEGCHTAAQYEAATKDMGFNPHQAVPASHPGGSYTCYDCHSMHDKSTITCAASGCHAEAAADLPDGWVAPAQVTHRPTVEG